MNQGYIKTIIMGVLIMIGLIVVGKYAYDKIERWLVLKTIKDSVGGVVEGVGGGIRNVLPGGK